MIRLSLEKDCQNIWKLEKSKYTQDYQDKKDYETKQSQMRLPRRHRQDKNKQDT
jgi:hypothetical protein